MNYTDIAWAEYDVAARASSFTENGVEEVYVVFESSSKSTASERQFAQLINAVETFLEEKASLTGVFCRFFVSDASNQRSFLEKVKFPFACSVVQQPPLNGTKVMAYLYAVSNSEVSAIGCNEFILKRPKANHYFNTQMQYTLQNEYQQTLGIFLQYNEFLKANGCTLKDCCIRTWIYVQGVDIHYAGMVQARGHVFEEADLTPATHFIASTGIEGRHFSHKSLVLMDAYAVKGVEERQITYLKGASHLNPTYEYGVTFERGTAVEYGDRRHVFISGTASINSKGEVVYSGDIQKQTERTVENVEVLLVEAGATFKDIAQLTIYLRDIADYETVRSILDERFSHLPKVYVWAPVCRPGWLIEIECIAIARVGENGFQNF